MLQCFAGASESFFFGEAESVFAGTGVNLMFAYILPIAVLHGGYFKEFFD